MPSSMTAFASSSGVFPWGNATWEIRSVNHRYLETWFRLPEQVRDLEMPLREKARALLNRGKLDASLQLQLSTAQHKLNINLDLAQQYIDALTQIGELCPESQPPSAMDILAAPGILEQPKHDQEAMHAELIALFQATLEKLAADRLREGEKLAEIVASRLDAIDQHTDSLKQEMPQIISGQQAKIREKLAELQTEINPERLEQELVLIAQKADVDEELDRLTTHTEEIRKTLKKKGPIGRRLDFLMQELNREANTLGSKSIAYTSSQTSIELKVLIEQMREQIQNIE